MRFFELHFNPQRDPSADSIFDSFCYEPENVFEKRLGYLFVVGQLQNPLPSVTKKFLDNLAAEIKKNYYSSPVKFSPEASLKNCLKKTNEFLEELVKKGDVSWLGNLNLAVFSLAPYKKDKFLVNFTKVGSMKILLLRPRQMTDIGKNLEFSEIEPYPLKIFSNIVSGKLLEQDAIAILTQNIFEYLSEKGLLQEIAKAAPFDESKFREILKNKEKELRNLSGICFLSVLTQELWAQEKKSTSLTFQREKEKFELKKVFLPIIALLKLHLKLKFLHFPRRNLILVLLFLLLLLIGFLLF